MLSLATLLTGTSLAAAPDARAGKAPGAHTVEVSVAGKGPPLEVTLEAMDHHRVPFASLTRMVGEQEVKFRFELGDPEASPAIEMIHVRSGAFDGWVDAAWSGAFGVFGGME